MIEPDLDLSALVASAWLARAHARVLGGTAVGCAVLGRAGKFSQGCNIEHRFRSHDIHAEVNAISSMVTTGETELRAIAIAAERERFSPCGACLDWIFELGGPTCIVAWASAPDLPPHVLTAADLMPFYPH